MQVFVSYSSEDRAFAARLSTDLAENQLPYWFDQNNLTMGTPDWKIAIRQGIEASDCVICLLSAAAMKSEWVHNELSLARLYKKPIIFLRLPGSLAAKPRFQPKEFAPKRFFRLRHADHYDNVVFRRLLPYLARLFNFEYTLPERVVTVTHAPLHAWNPVDYGRLLLWLIVDPPRLQLYGERRAVNDQPGWELVQRPGAWLASTALWLPLGLVVGKLDLPSVLPLPRAVLLGLLVVGWLVTALLGMRSEEPLTGAAIPALGAGLILAALGIGSALTYSRFESAFLVVPVALAMGSGLAWLLVLHVGGLDLDLDTAFIDSLTGSVYVVVGLIALGVIVAALVYGQYVYVLGVVIFGGVALSFSQHQQEILARVLRASEWVQQAWGAFAVVFVMLVVPSILLRQHLIFDDLFWQVFAPAFVAFFFLLFAATLTAMTIRDMYRVSMKLVTVAVWLVPYALLIWLYVYNGWSRLL